MESFNPELAATRLGAEGDLHSWQPIYGWPMNHIASAEGQSPGYLWRLMKLGPERRQVMFASLARRALDAVERQAPMSAAEVGALLDDTLSGGPRTLVERTFGTCPDGFLGGLRKLGFTPHSHDTYLNLWNAMAGGSPEAERRAAVIRQLSTLDEGLLGASLSLNLDLLSPRMVARARSAAGAKRINERARVVLKVCSGENPESLRTAIEAEENRAWPGWFASKLRNADRPLPHCLPTDGIAELERVTPHNATRFGAEFRNCLRNSEVMLSRLLSGSFALVCYRGAFKALLEMVRLDDGWVISMIHTERNGDENREQMLHLRSVMQPLDVRVLIVAHPEPDAEVLRKEVEPHERMIDILDLD